MQGFPYSFLYWYFFFRLLQPSPVLNYQCRFQVGLPPKYVCVSTSNPLKSCGYFIYHQV
jgi:hypothetical protein